MVSHAKRVVFIVGVRTVKVDMLVSCSRGGQLRVDKVADKTLCKLNNNNNNNTKKRKGKPKSVAGVGNSQAHMNNCGPFTFSGGVCT